MKIGQEIKVNNETYSNLSFQLLKKLGENKKSYHFVAKANNWEKKKGIELVLKFLPNDQISQGEKDFLYSLLKLQNSGKAIPSHNGIIEILDIFHYENYLVLAMEKGEYNLFDYMQKMKHQLKADEKVQICLDILKALNFLHSHQFCHTEIDLESFVRIQGSFKLINFGQAGKPSSTLLKIKPNDRKCIYFAPEKIQSNENLSDKTDVWSLGCIIFEIFSETPLFQYTNMFYIREQLQQHMQDQKQIFQKVLIMDGNEVFKKKLKETFQPDSNKRLKLSEIKDLLIQNLKSEILIQGPQSFQHQSFQPQLEFQHFIPQHDSLQQQVFDLTKKIEIMQAEIDKLQKEKSTDKLNMILQEFEKKISINVKQTIKKRVEKAQKQLELLYKQIIDDQKKFNQKKNNQIPQPNDNTFQKINSPAESLQKYETLIFSQNQSLTECINNQIQASLKTFKFEIQNEFKNYIAQEKNLIFQKLTQIQALGEDVRTCNQDKQ